MLLDGVLCTLVQVNDRDDLAAVKKEVQGFEVECSIAGMA